MVTPALAAKAGAKFLSFGARRTSGRQAWYHFFVFSAHALAASLVPPVGAAALDRSRFVIVLVSRIYFQCQIFVPGATEA